MKLIPLTQGKFAKVDDDDIELLSLYKWHYSRTTGYAETCYKKKNGKWSTMTMQKLINNTPIGYVTDHKDREKLNNQKNNLRTCSVQQNTQNASIRSNSKSGFRGVSYSNSTHKWDARIKHTRLGFFESKIEAAKAYDEKAKELFGEFAALNFGGN